MKRAILLAGMISLLLIVTSCGSDHGVGPGTISLTVEVVDTHGAPVPGLDLSVAADLPYYQDGLFSPAKAAVMLPFTTAKGCSVSLDIEDIEGTAIRELARRTVHAGQFHYMWDGEDDQGQHMASGVYWVHMRAFDTGSADPLFEDRKPMYMAILDPGRVSVGTTGADGKIKLTDLRLFPSLYPEMTITATDETAYPIGSITFNGSMRFQLADEVNNRSMRFIEVVSGPGTLKFVWAPPAKAPASLVTVLSQDVGKRNEPPVGGFALGLPYPVPFN